MKKMLLVTIILMVASLSFAQELTISYFDGDVEVMDSGEWYLPEMGEAVKNNQQIKLGADSYAEINFSNTTIKLLKEGIYTASDIIESANNQNTWELGKIGGINFKNVINKGAYNSSAVMGVRGAKQETTEVEWIDSSVDYLEDGKASLDEGDIDRALSIFNEGIELSEDNRDQLLYYSALCYNLKGINDRSLNNLESIEVPENYDFYPDFVILKSNILLEGLEYENAEKLLNSYIAKDSKSEKAQIVYLLLSYSSNGMKNTENAVKYLNKVLEIDKSNEMGVIAEELLAKM